MVWESFNSILRLYRNVSEVFTVNSTGCKNRWVIKRRSIYVISKYGAEKQILITDLGLYTSQGKDRERI